MHDTSLGHSCLKETNLKNKAEIQSVEMFLMDAQVTYLPIIKLNYIFVEVKFS